MTEKKTKEELQIECLQQEIENLKKGAANNQWGIQKTNEGIKILYKELEKKNKELRKIDELKSEFVSIVSHELRTPLTVIKAGISRLASESSGKKTEDQENLLARVMDNVQRLGRIVDNLLDVSKLEAGEYDLHEELLDLVSLAKEVGTNFMPQMQKKLLELKTTFFQEKIEVFADKDKMIQVLTNLIGNAVKFTDKGGIIISVIEKDDCVECSISDTGAGIYAEDLPKVFDKFQQCGKKVGSGEKGTGLGLSISKGIVELHGGDIWAESESNKGTKFIFTLPRYSTRDFLRKKLSKGIGEAFDHDIFLLAMVFNINNRDSVKEKIEDEKKAYIIQELENLIKESLRHQADMVIRDVSAVFLILFVSKEEDAFMIEGRVKQICDEYLERKQMKDKVQLSCKMAMYPQDGKTEKELLRKLEQV